MHSASSPWPGEDVYAEGQDLQLLRLLPAHQQFRLINFPVVVQLFCHIHKKMNDRNDKHQKLSYNRAERQKNYFLGILYLIPYIVEMMQGHRKV